MRPEIEGHAIAGQYAGTAVVQFDLDGFRRNEAARTHDQLGAAGLVAVEVHGDQAVDHVALSRQHSLHVGGGGTRHDPKAIGVVNEIGNFRAPNLVLAGQAVGGPAGTADQLAFDDGGAVPRFGYVPGQIFAALATTEDKHSISVGLRHLHLLTVRVGSTPPACVPCAT